MKAKNLAFMCKTIPLFEKVKLAILLNFQAALEIQVVYLQKTLSTFVLKPLAVSGWFWEFQSFTE